MPFCKSCGSPVEGQFCAKCGTPAGAAEASGSARPAGSDAPVAASPQPAVVTACTGVTDNVAAMLCYVPFVGWLLSIIFLLVAPYNQKKFVRFNAFQSIFLAVACFVLWFAQMIMHVILPWGLGVLLGLFALVIWLGSLILYVFLMIKAYQNLTVKLPIIGDLAEKQA